MPRSWRAWARARRPNDQDEIDAIVLVMQEPLDGEPVVQAFNAEVGDRVAVATCAAHQRVIYYDPRRIAMLGNLAFEFIRDHELGHHRLKHVDCSGDVTSFAGYDEEAADCWAAARLASEQLRGRDVLISVSMMLRLLDAPASPPYPSTRERAQYLGNACGAGLPR